MTKLIIFLLSCFIQLLPAQSTRFVWLQKMPGNLESGNCYEINNSLELSDYVGKAIFKYVKKVSRQKCLPNGKTSYIFAPLKGRCFEGDTKTLGKNYFSYVNISLCKPEKIEYEISSRSGKPKCYEVDAVTKGQQYYRAVKVNFCNNNNTQYTWVKRDNISGKCYSVNPETKEKVLVKRNVCRPDQLSFTFIRTGQFKGYCVEQSLNTQNDYSYKSKIENCKPKNTAYFFYKEPGKMSGRCYELDNETNGNNYLNKVDDQNCK
jgi:hypothetical protein